MFTPTSTRPTNPPDVLVALERYLKTKGYTARVVEDVLYRKTALMVTIKVPEAEDSKSTFFVLDGESLVIQNNLNHRQHGPVFPLCDPDIFDRMLFHLDSWYSTISQLVNLQHQLEDAKRSEGNSGP